MAATTGDIHKAMLARFNAVSALTGHFTAFRVEWVPPEVVRPYVVLFDGGSTIESKSTTSVQELHYLNMQVFDTTAANCWSGIGKLVDAFENQEQQLTLDNGTVLQIERRGPDTVNRLKEQSYVGIIMWKLRRRYDRGL